MVYAIANVSLGRKVVDKLARVYANGVKRNLPEEADRKKLEELSKLLNFDQQMKKANRYLKAFKNALAFPCPVKTEVGGQERYTMAVKILAPYLYDVIQDPHDRERAAVVILSDYQPETDRLYSIEAGTDGRNTKGGPALTQKRGDGQPSVIADDPSDPVSDQKSYVWWSKNYHFTTNEKGEITSKTSTNNPILALPFVNLSQDQDGEFWAIGGSDLMDGAIRVNAVLTHVVHISVVQGYGQLVMHGSKLPKPVKVGPNTAILLEYTPENGESAPDAKYISANPPVQDLLNLVSQYTALLLTTNNLSTSHVSTELNSGSAFPSGVAMLIDKAESHEDVQDQQATFQHAEPAIWSLLSKWMEVYKGALVDELQPNVIPPENLKGLTLVFGTPQTVLSEMERLDVIKKRQELGLNTAAELLMMDQPGLTEDEALKKLEKVMEEKQKAIETAQANMAGPGSEDEPGKPGEETDDVEEGQQVENAPSAEDDDEGDSADGQS
jgi:hypothetical protein